MIINTLYSSKMKECKHCLVTESTDGNQNSDNSSTIKDDQSTEVTVKYCNIILKNNVLTVEVPSVPKKPAFTGTPCIKKNSVTR